MTPLPDRPPRAGAGREMPFSSAHSAATRLLRRAFRRKRVDRHLERRLGCGMNARERNAPWAIGCALTLAVACARSGPAAFPIQGYSDEVTNGVAQIPAASARFENLDS